MTVYQTLTLRYFTHGVESRLVDKHEGESIGHFLNALQHTERHVLTDLQG